MRITNNMIMGNTKTNINSTKVLVDFFFFLLFFFLLFFLVSEDFVFFFCSLNKGFGGQIQYPDDYSIEDIQGIRGSGYRNQIASLVDQPVAS